MASQPSVCTIPGATAASRMPCWAHSWASVEVSDSTAARAALECAMPGMPRRGVIVIETILPDIRANNIDIAVQIAEIPEEMRGFGHVKEANVHNARIEQAELLREFRNPLRLVRVA